jgi:hypothetical protein
MLYFVKYCEIGFNTEPKARLYVNKIWIQEARIMLIHADPEPDEALPSHLELNVVSKTPKVGLKAFSKS